MAKFKPGESGNRKGRPKGTGEAAKLRRAIAKDAPDIIAAMAEAAKNGDTAAAKLLLDRVAPALKSEAQPVELPNMKHGGLPERATAALDAAAEGRLAPDTASELVAAVGKLARVVEIDELEKRLQALERAQESKA